MSSNIMKTSSYKFAEGDKFLFDTNIWLYLYCPVGGYNQQLVNSYNNFYLDILKNKCDIYINSLILSEFFNSYCRIEFKIRRKQNPQLYRDYKRDFRNTSEYESLSSDIIKIIEQKILKRALRISDNFEKLDMDDILIASKSFDYNDKVIAKLCEEKNIKVVTNDSDFKKIGNKINIITM